VQTIAAPDFLQVFAQPRGREGGSTLLFCKLSLVCFFASLFRQNSHPQHSFAMSRGSELVESQSSAQKKSVAQRKKGDSLLDGKFE
jgi:hypothetical protein